MTIVVSREITALYHITVQTLIVSCLTYMLACHW